VFTAEALGQALDLGHRRAERAPGGNAIARHAVQRLARGMVFQLEQGCVDLYCQFRQWRGAGSQARHLRSGHLRW
jgi:hypothetical protein